MAALWSDVRVVAERLQEEELAGGSGQVRPHFLGAIVLDQPRTPAGFIAVRHIVDGQQAVAGELTRAAVAGPGARRAGELAGPPGAVPADRQGP